MLIVLEGDERRERDMRWRSHAVCALLAGVALLLNVIGPTKAADLKSGPSILRIAVSGLSKSVFPFGARTSELSYLRGFVGRSLTIYDKSWAVACALCIQLPTLENGSARIVERADGSRGIDVTFDLAPDLAWDDGVPVTSADVLFAISVAHKLGDGSAALPNIVDAEALGDHRVTLHVANVRFDYNRMEELFLLPAHLEKQTFDSAASLNDYREHSLYTVSPASGGLSYGPYKIADLTAAEIVLVRNPFWHGKRPAFDQIVLRRYADISAVAADLTNGQVDMVAGEMGFDLSQIMQFEAKDLKSAYNFIFKPALNYEHIDLNLSNAMLQDKRVRQALLYGLDRPIADNGLDHNMMGAPPRSFLPPTSPNFDPTLSSVPYDPAKASALLDAAGFHPGADGIRVESGGRRLGFRLAAQLDGRSSRLIAEAVRDQLRQIGVEIVLENKRMAEVLPHRQFDLAVYAWINAPEFLLEPVYAKSGIPSAENGYRGLNFPGFDNSEMNQVAAALTTEMDPAKRLLLWARAQHVYADELPALPLAFKPDGFILPAAMTGVEPTGQMIPTSYWVEDWKLR